MDTAPGAPAAREGESREQYTQRLRAERNRRHRESAKERAVAASAAGKLAAAAAKPPSVASGSAGVRYTARLKPRTLMRLGLCASLR